MLYFYQNSEVSFGDLVFFSVFIFFIFLSSVEMIADSFVAATANAASTSLFTTSIAEILENPSNIRDGTLEKAYHNLTSYVNHTINYHTINPNTYATTKVNVKSDYHFDFISEMDTALRDDNDYSQMFNPYTLHLLDDYLYHNLDATVFDDDKCVCEEEDEFSDNEDDNPLEELVNNMNWCYHDDLACIDELDYPINKDADIKECKSYWHKKLSRIQNRNIHYRFWILDYAYITIVGAKVKYLIDEHRCTKQIIKDIVTRYEIAFDTLNNALSLRYLFDND